MRVSGRLRVHVCSGSGCVVGFSRGFGWRGFVDGLEVRVPGGEGFRLRGFGVWVLTAAQSICHLRLTIHLGLGEGEWERIMLHYIAV